MITSKSKLLAAVFVCCVLGILALGCSPGDEALAPERIELDLTGDLPPNWEAPGPDAWIVRDDGILETKGWQDGPDWSHYPLGDRGWTDVTVTYRFKPIAFKDDTWSGGHLYIRHFDEGDSSIRFVVRQNKVYIGQWVDGVMSEVATLDKSLDLDRWYDVKVIAEGKNYQVYLDGEKILEFTDSEATSGSLGLAGWTVRFAFADVVIERGDL